MARERQRVEELNSLLDEEVIDCELFRTFCRSGIPDKPGLRSLCWKILLGYLPYDKSQWDRNLSQQRAQYRTFLDDFIIDTHQSKKIKEEEDDGSFEDPLGALILDDDVDNAKTSSSTSSWDEYFQENQFLDQIDKDVRRLCPEIAFFKGVSPVLRPVDVTLYTRVQNHGLETEVLQQNRSGLNQKRVRRHSDDDGPIVELKEGQEYHWHVVERILFIYTKLNPGQGYVQGMNEILGPIYFILASDPDPNWHRSAEADAFFCFTMLMADVRDVFIKSLDESDTGVSALMTRFRAMVAHHDGNIMESLEIMQLKPQFYVFRWLTVLLTQEFTLPDLIRLWDTLLAEQDRVEYLLYLCVAMLVNVRDTLLLQDFAVSLKTLQRYPSDDVVRLIRIADGLRDQDRHLDMHLKYGRNT